MGFALDSVTLLSVVLLVLAVPLDDRVSVALLPGRRLFSLLPTVLRGAVVVPSMLLSCVVLLVLDSLPEDVALVALYVSLAGPTLVPLVPAVPHGTVVGAFPPLVSAVMLARDA